jgi:hypothetical protein
VAKPTDVTTDETTAAASDVIETPSTEPVGEDITAQADAAAAADVVAAADVIDAEIVEDPAPSPIGAEIGTPVIVVGLSPQDNGGLTSAPGIVTAGGERVVAIKAFANMQNDLYLPNVAVYETEADALAITGAVTAFLA